ncbi:MAG: hypothetical protein AB7F35_02435 [Acetobacteraceae bacterium]
MGSYLRLRQICLVAPELRPAEEDIVAVLGTKVCYRDPNVAAYGLENALFPLGADILEVVAPTQEGTAAGRFLQRSGGRGGYMVILDCDDIPRRRRHVEAMGVRVAHSLDYPGYLGIQLHPRDCRAAMLDFNCTEGGEGLDGPYHPAGDDWPRIVRPEALPALGQVEIESPDPAGLAAHWARIMDVPVSAGATPVISLSHGTMVFVSGKTECLLGLTVRVADAGRCLAAAAQRGLQQEDGAVWLSGVRIRLEQAA